MAENKSVYKVVLIRHGESQWNKDNKFTGWADVELSEKGHQEGKQAGLWLKEKGIQFDVAFTSVLKRAIQTLWHVLEETDQVWLPVNRRWRLNERMYGALQGLNKSETAAKHGEEQVCHPFRHFILPCRPVDRLVEHFLVFQSSFSNFPVLGLGERISINIPCVYYCHFWSYYA